ncbi:MAG TPA: TerD family protein [Arenimonas sp.]|nr:TerD family protein [Arenimonas sp.]
MTVSLRKGQGVSLLKSQYDLSLVTLGLGWDVAEEKKGLLGSFLSKGKSELEYDLDAVAFLLDTTGKVNNLGDVKDNRSTLNNGDIVYYNSLKHFSGNIWLTGDNRTGAGDGDDEQIIVRLDAIDQRYQRIVFVVQIYQGIKNCQHFGKVRNAFIRAIDAKGKEMVRYDLSGDSSFNEHCSMVFAELVRDSGGWQFKAIGKPYRADSFVTILKDFI